MENKTNLNVSLSELNKDDKYEVVYINGNRIQIKKGEDVMVDPIVKDVIKESSANRRRGNTQEEVLAL